MAKKNIKKQKDKINRTEFLKAEPWFGLAIGCDNWNFIADKFLFSGWLQLFMYWRMRQYMFQRMRK